MPRRALIERRPWLLASLATALAYYGLKDADFPGVFLYAIEIASLVFLAAYALLRHSGGQARMMAGAMALSGIGVAAVELDLFAGTVMLVAALALLIGIFLQHRRERLTFTQKFAAADLLLLTPVIAWFLSSGHQAQPTTATFGLAAGGMAAAAWASAFPRYRVGAGGILYVVSSLLTIATAMGRLENESVSTVLSWPLFYLGHFLICTGVIQTLRGNRSSPRR